ncbi:MAG: succinate dehydrogenase/fumarate reductase iron-sulfur subunit [Aquificae bacterium]|nr:succinate dehydrogenase/fumarate reductase iron-sulfur subunit [Aquificota bacterium]
MEKKLRLRIYRYVPEEGREGFQEYEVGYEEGMTFLRAFQKIKEEIDPTLSFRAFCRAGICGTCAVFINGFPKLACREQVLPYLLTGRVVEVEPLRGFPVVRDLVVDTEKVIKKMKELRLWIEEGREVPISPEQNRKIERGADCILCFSCHSYCPQVLEEEYAGPLLFAKIHRLLVDPRDPRKEFRLEEAFEGELYHCLSCNKCNNTCPKEVTPADLIRELMTVQSIVNGA